MEMQIGCCCKKECLEYYYRHAKLGGSGEIAESNSYYSLNKPYYVPFVNPYTGATLTNTPLGIRYPEFEVLILNGSRAILSPTFGTSEFVIWLERGKSIFVLTDYVGRPGPIVGSDYPVVNAMLNAIGAGALTAIAAKVPTSNATEPNVLYGTNNLNHNIPTFNTAFSCVVSGGTPILASSLAVLCVGTTVGSRNGKVLLFADQQLSQQRLILNICETRYQPIA